MGTSFFLLHFYFFVCALTFTLNCIASKAPKLKIILAKIRKRLYFAIPLTFFYQSYLETIISIAINLENFEWDSKNGSIVYNQIFTFAILIVSILLLFFTLFFYPYNSDKLQDKHFRTKWGALYLGMYL